MCNVISNSLQWNEASYTNGDAKEDGGVVLEHE